MSSSPPPLQLVDSNDRLLSDGEGNEGTASTPMAPFRDRGDSSGKAGAAVTAEEPLADAPSDAGGPWRNDASGSQDGSDGRPVVYRVYRRRFFGLTQLVLLNVIVSWDVCHLHPRWHVPVRPCAHQCLQWLTFSAVSTTAAQYFDVSESAINWLSTGFLFAFVAAMP